MSQLLQSLCYEHLHPSHIAFNFKLCWAQGSKSTDKDAPFVQSSSARVSSSWRRPRLTDVMHAPKLRLETKGSSMLGPTSELPSSCITTCRGSDFAGASR